MSAEFAIANVSPGRLNALVKNIMRQTGQNDPVEAVRLINSGEWVVSRPTRSWREEDGIVYFSVTSDGTTGEDWIKRLRGKGFCIDREATKLLQTPSFKPTAGVTTEVAVLKSSLFKGSDRIERKIRDEGHKRGLSKPNVELACLIRDKFTEEDMVAMGLFTIAVMHEPIRKGLLCVNCDYLNGQLGTRGGYLEHSDFAFAVSASRT